MYFANILKWWQRFKASWHFDHLLRFLRPFHLFQTVRYFIIEKFEWKEQKRTTSISDRLLLGTRFLSQNMSEPSKAVRSFIFPSFLLYFLLYKAEGGKTSRIQVHISKIDSWPQLSPPRTPPMNSLLSCIVLVVSSFGLLRFSVSKVYNKTSDT